MKSFSVDWEVINFVFTDFFNGNFLLLLEVIQVGSNSPLDLDLDGVEIVLLHIRYVEASANVLQMFFPSLYFVHTSGLYYLVVNQVEYQNDQVEPRHVPVSAECLPLQINHELFPI